MTLLTLLVDLWLCSSTHNVQCMLLLQGCVYNVICRCTSHMTFEVVLILSFMIDRLTYVI